MSEEINKHLYALIICGGGGTRLWPRSRNKTPKQFSLLLGKETLYQKTFKRLKGLVSLSHIYVITTTREYAEEIKRETPAIPSGNIFWEPIRRDTAMACGLGTMIIYQKDPRAIIMNFWADHLIKEKEVFLRAESVAARLAFEDKTLVAIGSKPRYPHTGLGYIKAGRLIKEINNFSVYQLKKFVEKPDLSTAKKLIAEGNCYWNSGMYVWPADFFLECLKKYSPEIYHPLQEIGEALGSKKFLLVMKRAYQKAPSLSVDIAVSEKVENGLVIPVEMGWNDIGDWREIYEVSSKDKEGNVIIKFGKKGDFVGLESKNNLVQFNNRLIALVGVEDLIVVDTIDAILICQKNKAQKVKELVKILKERKKERYL